MYSVLRVEMYRAGITIKSLAERIGVSEKTMRNKISGDTPFTWPEALAVKKIVNPKMDMETLFAVDTTA